MRSCEYSDFGLQPLVHSRLHRLKQALLLSPEHKASRLILISRLASDNNSCKQETAGSSIAEPVILHKFQLGSS